MRTTRPLGSSRWMGVRLRSVLALAGVRPTASKFILRGADYYSDSIPIEESRDSETPLARAHNGQPLARPHGLPARVPAPEIYGMEKCKRLVELALTARDFKGYGRTRGWSDEASGYHPIAVNVCKDEPASGRREQRPEASTRLA